MSVTSSQSTNEGLLEPRVFNPLQPVFSRGPDTARMNTYLSNTIHRPAARVVRFVLLAVILTAVAVPSAALSPVSASPPAQTKLTAAAGTQDAKFGTSVSIDGNTAVVGAPDEGGMGAAYVFTKRGARWVEQATLVPVVRTQGERFGYDVAISGDTIVVGAPNADQTRLIADPGVAYVFVRTPRGWSQQAKLSPSDSRTDDAFGFGVAISGDTILVGANAGSVLPSVESGAAYVFTRAGQAWNEQAKLTPADGAPDDNFGFSVALSGDTAVVGMPRGDVGRALGQGSARVFTRRGGVWAEQATLTVAEALPGDWVGASTSISGDTVVIGASGKTIGSNPSQGAAYVFTREGGVWTQTAELIAPDGTANDGFGHSVTATDQHVAVGAHFDDGGSTYVFRRDSGWQAPTKLRAEGAALLGVSVWMSGHTVISGANFTAVDGKNAQGAAYVFDLRQ